MWCLAGDIGGTNTRLLAVEWAGDQPIQQQQKNYSSPAAENLLSIVQDFVAQFAITQIHAACFAVAGPVREGSAKITNLPWQIHQPELVDVLKIPQVSLINDFAGVAYGISSLSESDVQTLQAATPQPDGIQLVLGAGTGLGMAIIKRNAGNEDVIETEAGHVGFSPTCEQEMALMAYWQERMGRVSNETFLSGKGIARIFDFYCSQAKTPAAKALLAAMQHQDPATLINEYAQKYKEPIARQSMQCFAAIYASVTADMALATKATGGVYLAGGIAPGALAFLQSDQFIRRFNNKPPMQSLLASIPVKVITNTLVGLRGAMRVARMTVE